jgi:hypothetical protein
LATTIANSMSYTLCRIACKSSPHLGPTDSLSNSGSQHISAMGWWRNLNNSIHFITNKYRSKLQVSSSLAFYILENIINFRSSDSDEVLYPLESYGLYVLNIKITPLKRVQNCRWIIKYFWSMKKCSKLIFSSHYIWIWNF